MSQKIDGSHPVAQAHSLRGSVPANKAGASNDAPAAAVAPADSLKLTGEATHLQAIERGLAAAPAIDAGKVEAVQKLLETGNYRINPEAIASRMLELDRQLFG